MNAAADETNLATYDSLDEALEMLATFGPDLRNGMTSHAPMAAEALCAMGRADAVLPWVERYRRGMLPWPEAQERISPRSWRTALGRMERVADWRAFFAEELEQASWSTVLDRWTARLAPGMSAAATHGVIRVGHAVRSLGERESSPRRRELADALAAWAATYEELPTSLDGADGGSSATRAIDKVVVVPPERRRFAGSITSALEALADFPEFAPAIGLLDVRGEAARLVPELTDVFARVHLANAHDFLTAIVFVHGVTSIAAVGNLLPHVGDATARAAVRYAWQSACALYATFGSQPTPARQIEAPREDEATLVDMAVTHGDEHVIKFTETCLSQHALQPSPAYLAAARSVFDFLPRE